MGGTPPGHHRLASLTHWVGVGGLLFGLGGLLPRDWLHLRHVIWMFSGVSCPPLEAGIMWSASGLLGCRPRVQSSVIPQVGQCVRCLAWWSAVWRALFQFAVPVRDVAMFVP